MKPSLTTMENYRAAAKKAEDSPEVFWGEIAKTEFHWSRPFTKVLSWNFEKLNVRWFEDGKLNITENILDRWVREDPERTAILFEANEPNDSRSGEKWSYRKLQEEVNKVANGLVKLGVGKGDRVCVYMPMVPEAAVAMLACARIGAIHSVVFGGFSAQSLADRLKDADAKVLLTADEGYRGGKITALKAIADEAMKIAVKEKDGSSVVKTCVVYPRTGAKISFLKGRDRTWSEVFANESTEFKAIEIEAEHPLFILYTSGSTGKPKGVVHTTAGYMVYTAYTFANVFNYRPKEVYWCTADVGWITGHSYGVYGPLLCGATVVFFEGVPNYPDDERFWQIIDKYKVNIFYTAPTAIRSLQARGLDPVKPYSLESIRLLGSVGEPINQEAWDWYHKNIGKGKSPIVDTWWQTETGGIMISPLGSVTPLRPTYATLPLPGIQPILMNEKGQEIKESPAEGNLCIKFPWPGMLRTTWGDHDRCQQTYFATYPGYYFTGDGARREADGYFRILGRVDDVMNVSGHRIGTAEVENAIDEHPAVIESAVVSMPHPIKGQGIYAFVIYTPRDEADAEKVEQEILDGVAKIIGPIAKPDRIQFVPGLPKTRSGKIMRRILRKVAEGDLENLGDIATLVDPEIVEVIKNGRKE